MNAEQWKAVKELLDALDEFPEQQRPAQLEALEIPDPQVRAEVASMLAAQQRQGGFMDVPPVAAPDPPRPSLEAGARLGAFRVETLIGRGGTSEVYRARRCSGFEQVVAIKLLSETAQARFEYFHRERRILAAMEHPGIARIIDGGVSDAGRPYMVMEYVEGTDLVQHARERMLDLPARLELFRQACDAVSYAHRHLVIHRDLKPGNIRVTPQGQVKLLDFGVAKLVEPDARNERFETATVLTPEYAAPEQLYGETVTTATDVYALGAVLFNLLVGAPPFDTRGQPLHLAIDHLLRSELPSPSVAATRFAGSPIPPGLLRGDLDAIVGRAMRRKPTERYGSVGELWTDLARHLARQPVQARIGSTAYVLVRLVRRHRLALGAAAVSALAVLVGLSVALWQAREARQAAMQAQAQTERALRAKELLLSIFSEQDPRRRSSAQALTPAQLIARGLDRADDELAAEPALRADLLADIGELQVAFGDSAGGRVTLERAERERTRIYGPDSLERVETLRQLVEAAIDTSIEDALAYGERAMAILERVGQPQHPDGARIQLMLAPHMVSRAEGEAWLARVAPARAAIEAAFGRDDIRSAQARAREATALEQARSDTEAQAAAEDALARFERIQGADGSGLIGPLYLLGLLHKRNNAFDAAAQIYTRVADIARKHYGEHNNDSLADALIALADARQNQGRLDEAAALLDQARVSAQPGDTSVQGALYKRRGELELLRGRPHAAAESLRAAFENARKRLGEHSGFPWFVASRWGEALAATGQLEQAETVQRDALARLAAIMGEDAYQNALLQNSLARTLSLAGKHDEAVDVQRKAIAITQKTYAPGHAIVLTRQKELALFLSASPWPAAHAQALDVLDDAIRRMRDPSASKDAALLGELLWQRGQLHLRDGRSAPARADLEAVVAALADTAAGADTVAQARRLLQGLGKGAASQRTALNAPADASTIADRPE